MYKNTELTPAQDQIPLKVPIAGGGQRLLALDALRGFDMFWIVGAGALVHALDKMSDNAVTRFLTTQLSHVQWQGFHFYDLIFPLFVFIAGVSLVFSMERALAQQGKAKAIGRLARRCALLVLLGLFYYGGLSVRWPEIRLSGVLQYIGIACFCGGTLFIVLRKARLIAAVCATILVSYWALMVIVPFPDVQLDKESLAKTVAQLKSSEPAKVLQTATRRVSGCYEEGRNLSNYIDYRYLPGKKINGAYESQPLLGILGVVSACLLGILAGLWLRRDDVGDGRKVAGLLVAGAASVALGFLWGLQFPVIKKLWSSSFVLVAGGYSAMLLGVFYWIVEVRKKQTWCQPFVWIGMNPITIYLAHNIIVFPTLAARFAGGDVQAWLDVHLAKGAGGLLLAAVELSLTFLLVHFLYIRKIFIRL
ncbi:MAG: heparan-alpha-glucosaminide N-acetyltransferase domain-containing protein [Kiritimatiellaeota bacterium]|nr:heparan-alpha-glucosaminide N-acetyltransferase domain-containing protein [Kiritimatiellota bacterium]